jgi:hypothetical protein
MKPRRAYRPLVADSQNFDEEKDPDVHLSENTDQDPH